MSNSLTLNDFYSNQSNSSGLYSNAESFAGKKVVDYDANDHDDVVFRFRSDYEGVRCISRLKEFFASDKARSANAIVIGTWTDEMHEKDPSEVISLLVEQADTLSELKALYLGDVVSEENEMSWIIQTDLAPLLQHFPQLEYLRSRGSEGLKLSVDQHNSLRALALETGGLNVSVLRSISMASFPNLEHLEIWLGTDEYGGTCSVEDLQPILTGDVFPKLQYLGLRNYDQVDALCSVIVNSPVIHSLEVLDLSLGTLTDIGARALLNIPTDTSIQRLVLNYHFVDEALVADLQKLPFDVEMDDAQEDDDGWHFVAVGE